MYHANKSQVINFTLTNVTLYVASRVGTLGTLGRINDYNGLPLAGGRTRVGGATKKRDISRTS